MPSLFIEMPCVLCDSGSDSWVDFGRTQPSEPERSKQNEAIDCFEVDADCRAFCVRRCFPPVGNEYILITGPCLPHHHYCTRLSNSIQKIRYLQTERFASVRHRRARSSLRVRGRHIHIPPYA